MASRKFDHVFQFKITLLDISPPVWRTIQVPHTYSFWDLHVAIQDVMGWVDEHLHVFKLRYPGTTEKVEIGIPDFKGFGGNTLAGWEIPLAQFFTLLNRKAIYTYDFGDDWHHRITLQKILPREKNVIYPVCVSGRRACPPEDCGGPWGYQDFLEAITNPKHEEHESMLEWFGGPFDPERFDKQEVIFVDPDLRFRFAFAEKQNPVDYGIDTSQRSINPDLAGMDPIERKLRLLLSLDQFENEGDNEEG